MSILIGQDGRVQCGLSTRCPLHQTAEVALAEGRGADLRPMLDVFEAVARNLWQRECRCGMWARMQETVARPERGHGGLVGAGETSTTMGALCP